MANSKLSGTQLVFYDGANAQEAFLECTAAAAINFNGAAGSDPCLLRNVASPLVDTDVATKGYVDASGGSGALSVLAPVVAASTVNVDIATLQATTSSIDGETLSTGQRVLLKDQTNPIENGIYVIAATAPSTRSVDFAASTNVAGLAVFTQGGGNTNANLLFNVLEAPAGAVVGTNSITFGVAGGYRVTGTNLTLTGDNNSTITLSSNLEVTTLDATGAITASSSITGGSFITGTLTVTDGSISDTDGIITFGATNLTTTGTLGSGAITSSGLVTATQFDAGTLTMSAGSISDSAGINFGTTNLITTGTLGSGAVTSSATVTGNQFTAGTLTMTAGNISDSAGISFGTTNLTTTGTLGSGAITSSATVTGNQFTAGTLSMGAGSVSDSSGALSFGTTNLTTTGTLGSAAITSSANVTAVNFLTSSDRRLKTDISVLPDCLEKVGRLNGVSFNWINSGHADVGLIAQDVQEVLPEVVTTGDDGFLKLDYSRIVPLLVEAIKALSAEVAELKRVQ